MYWKCHSHRGKYKFTLEFKEIIQGLLAFNPDDRLTIQEIKETAFYKGEVATQEEVIEEFSNRLKNFND